MIKMLPLLTAALLLGLTGCTVHQSVGDSFGSYVSEPDGQAFKPVGYRWDYEHTALVYVYRPATQWSMDELETPSFNVDGERLFNVKGGGYTWYEMMPGEYDVVMRRGLLGLEGFGDFVIRTVAKLKFEVQAGKVYYLRYSEIDPPAVDPASGFTPIGDGPLQLVAPSQALAELPVTRMIHHGRGLLKPAAEEGGDMDKVFDATPAGAADGQPAADGELKARPRTKAEDWWPF
ncbi:DUF2846 domain-containing protein [Thalassolituus sp. LLYu03]|uniref:DUF2846 domain-containing protein n=1 Tax=Thalassolituus sp. LLYu03 TaxID=3421656 RepID=UPI003D2DDF70